MLLKRLCSILQSEKHQTDKYQIVLGLDNSLPISYGLNDKLTMTATHFISVT